MSENSCDTLSPEVDWLLMTGLFWGIFMEMFIVIRQPIVHHKGKSPAHKCLQIVQGQLLSMFVWIGMTGSQLEVQRGFLYIQFKRAINH